MPPECAIASFPAYGEVQELQLRRAKRSKKPRGAGRPRSFAADLAILRAALELFVEHGVDGASIEQIAIRAKVARTTVYRRWLSKEVLIAEAIAAARGEPEQAATSRVAVRDLPRRLVDALAETLATPNYRKLAARLIGSVPSSPQLMAVYWHKYQVPRRERIGKVLERARSEGLIREDSDSEMLLDLIGGAMIYHLLVRPGEPTVRETRGYLFKVLRQLGLSDRMKSG